MPTNERQHDQSSQISTCQSDVLTAHKLSLYPSCLSCRVWLSLRHNYLRRHHHEHHQSVTVSAISHPDLLFFLVIIASSIIITIFIIITISIIIKKWITLRCSPYASRRCIRHVRPEAPWPSLHHPGFEHDFPQQCCPPAHPQSKMNHCQCVTFFLDTDYKAKWLNGSLPAHPQSKMNQLLPRYRLQGEGAEWL